MDIQFLSFTDLFFCLLCANYACYLKKRILYHCEESEPMAFVASAMEIL